MSREALFSLKPMSTISSQQQQAIAAKLAQMVLPRGLGTEDNACSIAAINLALTGELSDDIPPCMSEVIGRWIIIVQDRMPAEMRNSAEWKHLLPLAAGTGREREQERAGIILAWMWETVLPIVQPVADIGGFGEEWKKMLSEQTLEAADAAASAANAVDYTSAANAADNVFYAVDAAASAARTTNAADNVFYAVKAVVYAARTANASAACNHSAWEVINPCGLLEKLIFI